VYISRNIMKIASYDLRAYLVYRKTISRPAYEYLNPSIRYIDQYLLETGNPSLRPQLTNNYEANVSVDERPIIAIGYNDTKDIFTNVIYRADSNNQVAVRTYDNLGTNKETYFRALGAIPPGKRYFFVVGAQYNHNFYNGLYESKPLTFKKGTWTIFTYQTFKITPLMQATLNGFARFKGQQQLYELSSFGALNFSLNQQFFKKKLIATVSISDIFLTNRNEFTISQGNVTANGFREGDTRRFGFNIRYNFGIRKKEENNIFNVESPERTN
jgi:iron complex outermembrane recepter protein